MQNPVITIEMMNGDTIKAELYPEIAPNTVNNFLSLVKKGFYNGLIFHRVISGFMHQGRVFPQRLSQFAGPYRGRFVHGPRHEPQLRRLPVLYHA